MILKARKEVQCTKHRDKIEHVCNSHVCEFVDTGIVGYWFWCPGCNQAHRFQTPKWTFVNGDMEKPTFTASYLVLSETKRCHLFMTDGKLIFLNDCFHALKGRTVNMVELPSWLADN